VNAVFTKYVIWIALVLAAGVMVPSVRTQRAEQAGRPHGRILFDSDRDGNSEIYAMEPDGSNTERLTHNEASDGGPAWSPDGKKIAFSSNRDGHLEIYIVDAGGSNPRRLTRTLTGGKDSAGPNWSPDGKRIVFASNRDRDIPDQAENRELYDIYAMDADGSNVSRLTYSGGFGSDNPDWSPDGNKIAFDSRPDPNANREIYLMDADGSNLRRLTQTRFASSHAVWSPDGKRIAFQSNRNGNMEIYVMDADGFHVQRLTNTLIGQSLNPVWSPDGKQIAFGSTRDGNMQIYVVSSDGSDLRRLTSNTARDAHPDW